VQEVRRLDGETSREDRQHQLFMELFGVSEEELRTQGVDPDEYLHQHLREALSDPERARLVLPESVVLQQESFKYGGRFYLLMFAALSALLATYPIRHSGVRFAFVGLAGLLVTLALWEMLRQLRTHLKANQAARTEGRSPTGVWGQKSVFSRRKPRSPRT
jgi:hypothetical protein